MKIRTVALGAAVLALALAGCDNVKPGDVKPGAPCATLDERHTNADGQLLTCHFKNNEQVWLRDWPIVENT